MTYPKKKRIKYVPDYALMLGAPARQKGWMSEYGHRLEFNENGEAICPDSKKKYLLSDKGVEKQ